LAELRRVGFLPGVWLAPEAIRDLRQLVRYRQQLVNERRAVKLRVRALLREWRVATPASLWNRAGLAWLRDEALLPPHSRLVLDRHLTNLAQLKLDVAAADKALRAALAADPIVTRLRTSKGVGWITAAVLRAEVGWFGRFRSGKQLSRFCGLSPRNASSGQRQADAGLVRGCSQLLRATLIELAQRLMLYEPRWQEFKARLRARGKPACLIAAAVANRWVRKLYYDMLGTV
jgi:transposase